MSQLDMKALDLRLRELGADRGISLPLGGSRRQFMMRASAAGLISATYGVLLSNVARAQVTVTKNIRNAPAWSNHTFTLRERCTNAGNAYECTTAGTSTGAPTGTGTGINNGGSAVFKWSSAVDYTTSAAWVTANQGTLSNHIEAQFWNDLPGTSWPPMSISGITNSSTAQVTITAAPGESFADHPSNRLGVSDPNNGVCFNSTTYHVNTIDVLAVKNFTMTRLQVIQGVEANGNNGVSLKGLDAGTLSVTGNILCAGGHHDGFPLVWSIYGGSYAPRFKVVVNNNAFPWRSVAGDNQQARATAGTGTRYDSRFESNSILRPSNYGGTSAYDFAILGGNTNQVDNGSYFRNNVITNFGNDAGYPPYGTVKQIQGNPDGHNATDLANLSPGGFSLTSVTVGNVTSVNAAACFNNQSNAGGLLDLRIPNTSALKGVGNAVSALYSNEDIYGNTRPNGAVDIGAVQISTASPVGVVLPIVIHSRPGS